MIMTPQDYIAALPLGIVAVTAFLVLLIEAFRDGSVRVTSWLTAVGLAAAFFVAMTRVFGAAPGTAFFGMYATGAFPDLMTALFCVSGILTVLLSSAYLGKEHLVQGEYYAVLLSAVAGMIMMAAAADLVFFFLGLELMSIAFYILAGFARGRLMSNEAGLKYFLLGAFSTGFLLYGIALVYGATGRTAISAIPSHSLALAHSPVFVVGLALVLVGLLFKVAAFPFHMWAPDVYEGAPTTVSGFMATGGKAAAFSGFLLIFSPLALNALPTLSDVIALIAAASMILGNIVAVSQTSIKRMLAYSSIAHAGYILAGVVAGNRMGAEGVIFYLAAYTLMNIGAFGVVSILESGDGTGVTYDECAGLSRRAPVLSGLMAVFMFSLTGIPPFAGFFGKYYVFAGAIGGGYTWLAIIGVLMSVGSASYYLRLVVLMYFKEGTERNSTVSVPAASLAALVIAAIGLLGLGLFPSLLLQLTAWCF